MVDWFGELGCLVRVGVEGCGSYGAGLARYLPASGIEVVEVNRTNRQLRPQRGGKSDSVDAEGAARATASGQVKAVSTDPTPHRNTEVKRTRLVSSRQ